MGNSIITNCSIENCDNNMFSRTWCRNHYNSWYKYGNPTAARTNSKRGSITGPKYLYYLWAHIKQRTGNKNYHEYKYWGGRGIRMCSEWDMFADFKDWVLCHLGERPDSRYSFDRIDNDGDYMPGNVRWADKTTQVTNQRLKCTNKSGYKGVLSTSWGPWLAQIDYNKQHFNLGYYDTKEEAIHIRQEWERQLGM